MFPPRPDGSTHPDTINQYQGWWGQRKFNGTRTLIFIHEYGSFVLWNRHREQHKSFQINSNMENALKDISARCKRGKIYVFDGELMHSKTRGLKNRIILWDILVHESNYLIGTTYAHRYSILNDFFNNPKKFEQTTGHKIALEINTHVWLAEIFKKNLKERFKELISLDEIEGIVLKNPTGLLEFGFKESNNGNWLIRVRKPHKNYEF